MIDKKYNQPLDEMIDSTIQACPINILPKMYNNIILSGGSTRFKNFNHKLELLLQIKVDERLKKHGSKNKIKVNVTEEKNETCNYYSWFGASRFGTLDTFKNCVHTREEYFEKGKSCCQLKSFFSDEYNSQLFQ